MRFVVYGAGAIGGVIGGRLFEHGHDVVLVARGEHARAIRGQGLRLADPDRSVTLAVPVVEQPSDLDLGPADVVVLAMKTQDTQAALDALDRARRPPGAVACAQNGVANERHGLAPPWAGVRHLRHVSGHAPGARAWWWPVRRR